MRQLVVLLFGIACAKPVEPTERCEAVYRAKFMAGLFLESATEFAAPNSPLGDNATDPDIVCSTVTSFVADVERQVATAAIANAPTAASIHDACRRGDLADLRTSLAGYRNGTLVAFDGAYTCRRYE